MICSRCKKRPAVVFVQRGNGNDVKSEGFCLSCASELKIPQVENIMKQFGVSPENIDAMEERFNDMIGEGGMEDFMKSMEGVDMKELMSGFTSGNDDEADEDFTPGGSPSMPFMFDATEGENKGKDKKKKQKDNKRKMLDTYCENLTGNAKKGIIDNVIGRDREIYRTIQILCRRQKNNPCLIGEAGVGKTAIAEGIAIRIANGDVPAILKDKEIYLLDLTSLVAGTQFRGQFESRVKGLIAEVKALGNIILFIDEIHNITGAGDSEGSMNAANILKPALSRGQIQVIGATTFTEYRKYIEKDQALERRFQPVKVDEPSIEDTIDVISGVKEYYEKHHHVKVNDDVVRLCVSLSERYITDRFLPDKAIDLLDESCACCSLRHEEITEFVELNKKLLKLKAQEKHIEEQTEEFDYEELAKLKMEIAEVEKEFSLAKEKIDKIEVTIEDVAKVIELWTGIPSVKIQKSQFTRLNNLENSLKEKIIGQDEAVNLVSKAVRRASVGISARKRPASFIFVGPTGVGKTELVKQLSLQLFDTVDPLIRLDMSEFMEKHAVSRIIGSPPGYVGYDEAGQLTEKVRRKPYSVVLFDEIEKAHPDVLNILLQILDEGKITDAQGRIVNFANTVIAMTSNAGSSDKMAETGFNKTKSQISKNKSLAALRDFLRPEFISRVDEVISFNSLEQKDLAKIASIMLDEYKTPLLEKGFALEYTDNATTLLCKKADGGLYAARDLRRVIRKEVEDKITDIIVTGEMTGTFVVDANEEEIVVTLK